MPTALVTGGNRGIGRGIVVELARRGFDVAFADLAENADTAATLAGALAHGARCIFLQGDIARIDTHAALLDAAIAALGPLHAVVNNAGVAQLARGDLLDLGPDELDRALDINLRGTFFFTQACARQMAAAPATALPRSIVTISSISAVAASIERGAYCISKSALSMLVKLFALRLAPHGIACHEVRPGLIRTAMTEGNAQRHDAFIAAGGIPQARWGAPEDVGRVVASLCAGDLPYATGEAIHVDGGMLVPRM